MTRAIAVTGSQGFVGKHVRRALERRGFSVIGIDRPGSGAEIEQDLSDPELDTEQLAARCKQVCADISGVIYMAATITRGSSVDSTARSNLRAIAQAAVELFEAFHARVPEAHFVYCSTYKGYGPPEQLPIDPQRPPQRPDPHSYGSAKALAERLLAIASARIGAPYAVVRPTCIYGPGQHLHNAIPLFLRAALSGRAPTVFGTGQDVRDDVYAPDLAHAMIEACLRKATGPFHATGENARTIFEVAEACCRAVAELGGPQGLQPVLDPSKPPKWWLNQVFDWSRSRELLGYAPTPFVQALKAEALWIKDGAPPERSVEYAERAREGA